MHDYTKLKVYKDCLDFTIVVYDYTKQFPDAERYSLTNQLCRAMISVPSNIAEGCGRSTNRDTAKFLSIAIGSIHEVDTQLRIADALGYGSA